MISYDLPTDDEPSRTLPPRGTLWRIGDVAAYLTLSEGSARKVLGRPTAPRPVLELSRIRLWYPPQFPHWIGVVAATAPERSPDTVGPMALTTIQPSPETLWRIGDVAAFLTLSKNAARDLLAGGGFPEPIVSVGDVRLWHASQWYGWAATAAGLVKPSDPTVDGGDELGVDDLFGRAR